MRIVQSSGNRKEVSKMTLQVIADAIYDLNEQQLEEVLSSYLVGMKQVGMFLDYLKEWKESHFGKVEAK